MAAGNSKPATRKRNRKRKRRAVSSSSSSSSSDSDSSSDSGLPQVQRSPLAKPQPVAPSSSSSSSGSDPDSDSDLDFDTAQNLRKAAEPTPEVLRKNKEVATRRRSASHTPPASIPSFLPPADGSNNDAEKEKQMRDKFRKFWMASVADGFKDDLEQIRKEPGLNTSRLALLIDSLASGADVFSSSPQSGNSTDINEIGVVLGSNED